MQSKFTCFTLDNARCMKNEMQVLFAHLFVCPVSLSNREVGKEVRATEGCCDQWDWIPNSQWFQTYDKFNYGFLLLKFGKQDKCILNVKYILDSWQFRYVSDMFNLWCTPLTKALQIWNLPAWNYVRTQFNSRMLNCFRIKHVSVQNVKPFSFHMHRNPLTHPKSGVQLVLGKNIITC